eukprot:gene6842-13858_t
MRHAHLIAGKTSLWHWGIQPFPGGEGQKILNNSKNLDAFLQSGYRSINRPPSIIKNNLKMNIESTLTLSSTANPLLITRNSLVRDLLKTGTGTALAKAFEDDTVLKGVEEMNKLERGSIIVYNNEGEVSGIFTERDFVTKILDGQRQSSETLMKDVMTSRTKLITGSPDMTIGQCQTLMVENKIRHLPIVSNGKLDGALSMSEIIRALQIDDQMRQKSKLFGESLAEVESQQREFANLAAIESGEAGSRQDTLRTTFIVSAAAVSAALLQGDWIHNHEQLSMIAVFILGYIGIVFENYFEFNKAAVALLMCTALWVIFAGTAGGTGIAITEALGDLSEKVSEVSEVVYFLLGAMTIVEIVDAHQGFKVVTDLINSTKKRDLLWVIGIITFFMSAILDNLTTTIVMVSLIKKILPNPEDRKYFGAMSVIAANAGGAWTPIGDVTTTMLWINGQITALPTMVGLFLPSFVSVLLSIAVMAAAIPETDTVPPKNNESMLLAPRGKLVFAAGICGLLSVPAFKALTGLPPYLGMLASLGVMWSLTDAIHAGEDDDRLRVTAALRKIDTSGVLFFLGILLSIGALDSVGLLTELAQYLNDHISYQPLIAAAIGFASAVIDNVPLVAATMGMYPIAEVPVDSQLWQLIAYCAGTGGSLLVIGSAAGVALMGLEKVDFFWYVKKVSLAALVGYLGGIGVYIVEQNVFEGNSAQYAMETVITATSSLQDKTECALKHND